MVTVNIKSYLFNNNKKRVVTYVTGRGSGTYLATVLPPWLFIIVDCIGSIFGAALIIGIDGNAANKVIFN